MTGYNSATDAFFAVDGAPALRDDYKNSLHLTMVLGAINFMGYVIITLFLGITEIPIIIAGVDQLVRTTEKEGVLKKSDGDYRDPSAWNAWFVVVVVGVGCGRGWVRLMLGQRPPAASSTSLLYSLSSLQVCHSSVQRHVRFHAQVQLPRRLG